MINNKILSTRSESSNEHIYTRTHRTYEACSAPHSHTHQLWGSGVSCWWSARENPKKVPLSPNLCRVWVVSRLKHHTCPKRLSRAQRKVVQRLEGRGDERASGAFARPTGAAIARCRASSAQEGAGQFPFMAPSVLKEMKRRQVQRSLPSWAQSSFSFSLTLPCWLWTPFAAVSLWSWQGKCGRQ